MANWISMPGNAIVSDHDSPVNIEYHSHGSIVKPKPGASFPCRGVFHAYIPSAPNGSPKAKHVSVKHTHILSKTCKAQVFHGSNMLYECTPAAPHEFLDIANLTVNINAEGEHLGWGVSVTVEFTGTSSILLVSSITMQFQ
jgi:hypothetical protein